MSKRVDIDELRALYEAATPGPWQAVERQIACPCNITLWDIEGPDCDNQADYELIAKLHTSLPQLLNELEVTRLVLLAALTLLGKKSYGLSQVGTFSRAPKYLFDELQSACHSAILSAKK